jgi:hypothetical protein
MLTKTNASELAGTPHAGCHNPVRFENGLLTCQDFSPTNPHLGLLLRSLSPLHQFAQISLLFLPNSPALPPPSAQTLSVQLVALRRKQVQVGAESATAFEKGEVRASS